ncbi:MAG: hypothetical protein JNM56_11990 [Planctomycetia bacterium]|nr:hypothetical protein [Planctomycetia bacterium]
MRRYTQIVFGINAIYLTVLGLFCLLAPAPLIGLYGGTDAEAANTLFQATFRVLGVKLIPLGVMCALITGNPDDNAVLRGMMGLLAVLTLVAYGIIVGIYPFNAAWLGMGALNVISMMLILVAAVFYHSKKKAPRLIAWRRAAA